MEDSITDLMEFEDRAVEEEKHSSIVHFSERLKPVLNTSTNRKMISKMPMQSYLNHKSNRTVGLGTPSNRHSQAFEVAETPFHNHYVNFDL